MQQAVVFLSRAASRLLLDTYEHLVEAGAQVPQELLERVEHLTVLVTSRQRLGLEGEREFPVAPLPVPATPARAPARAPARTRRLFAHEHEHEHEHEQDPAAVLARC